MAQILEAIVILLIVWQLMTRFVKNTRLSPNAKSEFKEAIDDAKKRLPNTGLFALFKGDSSVSQIADETQIEFEQTIVPPKGDEEDSK
tara:strand:+ start:547 stop:810 length:264 start_codon:yes stop_codon:yes gene_type:complete